jgi:hypothetical protein
MGVSMRRRRRRRRRVVVVRGSRAAVNGGDAPSSLTSTTDDGGGGGGGGGVRSMVTLEEDAAKRNPRHFPTLSLSAHAHKRISVCRHGGNALSVVPLGTNAGSFPHVCCRWSRSRVPR